MDNAQSQSGTSQLDATLTALQGGEKTTQVAASATPDAQAKLQQLGQALTAAGSQLKG